MTDTPAEVEVRFRRLMLMRSPSQRLTMACRMFSTAKALIRAGILEERGCMEPDLVRKNVFLRLYGHEFGERENTKILSSFKTT
jgi:hypothetical protein